MVSMHLSYIVREEHPLQQGLRHSKYSLFPFIDSVREEHPLQQGLRPFHI